MNKPEMGETKRNSMLEINSITVVNNNIVYTLNDVANDTDVFIEINKIDIMNRKDISAKLTALISGSEGKGWTPNAKLVVGLTNMINSLNKNTPNPVIPLIMFKEFGNWATNAGVVGRGKRPKSDNASDILKQILGFEITQSDIGQKTEGKPDYLLGDEIFHNLINKVFERR